MPKVARRLNATFEYDSFGGGRHRIVAVLPTTYLFHTFIQYTLDYQVTPLGQSNRVECLLLKSVTSRGEEEKPIPIVCDGEFAEMSGEVLGYFAYVREFIRNFETQVEAPKFEVYLDFEKRLGEHLKSKAA